MNSMFKCSRVVVGAALGAYLLVGCDSIMDRRSEPFTPIPPETAVVAGKLRGLGSARPIFLSANGEQNCQQPSAANSQIIEATHCAFFGVFNQYETEFTFGSWDVGTPYFIEVVGTQPFSKHCTVDNGIAADGNPATPTNPRRAGDGNPQPVVTCVALTEPDFTRFDVTVNTGPLSVLSNPRVILSTEDGILELPGDQASVTFEDAVFDNEFSLPRFEYQLYATFTDDSSGVERTSYCSFTAVPSGPDTLTTGGTNRDATATSSVVPPSGNVTANVASCTFAPTVRVMYSARPGETAPTTIPTGGVTLGLRNHYTNEIEQTLELAAGTAFSASTDHEFPDPVVGNDNSVYEIEVLAPGPDDPMKCVVGGTVTALGSIIPGNGNPRPPGPVTGSTGAAVLAINPAIPEWWTSTPRAVTCRIKETDTSRLLVGTYHRDRALQTASQLATNPPTIPVRAREFLTFFDDGTFLFGINHPTDTQTTCNDPTFVTGSTTVFNFPNCTSTTTIRNPGESGPTSRAPNPPGAQPAGFPAGNFNAASGVNHGFYSYDPVADTIVFTLTTASNIFPNYLGLNGSPGYTTTPATPANNPVPGLLPGAVTANNLSMVIGSVTANNVVKTAATSTVPGKISLRFGPGTRPGPRPGAASAHGGSLQTANWNMSEVVSIPGEITGGWATPDHKRVFVYDKQTYFGFHMGINGLATLQDACFIITDLSTQSAGQLVRHSGLALIPGTFTSTCAPGGSGNFRDVPSLQASQPFTMPKLPGTYEGRFPGSASQLDGRPTSPSNFVVMPQVGDPDLLTVTPTSNGVLIPNRPPIDWLREAANAPVP